MPVRKPVAAARRALSRRDSLGLAAGAAVLAAGPAQAAKQPNMREARQALLTAVKALRRAKNDEGGHRLRALSYAERALKQVEKGIEKGNRLL
ncbi:MAG: hypothetical protein AAF192_18800 [Pseudomonadota bacterium]